MLSANFLAVFFAMSTSVLFGLLSVLVRRGGLYANSMSGIFIGLFVSLPIMCIVSYAIWKEEWWNLNGIVLFCLAGLAGPAFSRVFLFLSINNLGVSVTMPLVATTPLFSSVLAYIFLSERPGPLIWFGTFMIVIGSALLSYRKTNDQNWERKKIWMVFVSTIGAGFSFVLRKSAFSYIPDPIVGATISCITGLFVLCTLLPVLPKNSRPDNMKNKKAWVFYGSCGLINAAGFTLNFAAMSHGDVSIVAPLTCTAPVFAILCSYFLLKDLEKITLSICIATAITVTGAILISWKFL